MKIFIPIICLISFLTCFSSQFSGPFSFEVNTKNEYINVKIEIPEKHYIYAKSLNFFDSDKNEIFPVEVPISSLIKDPNGENKEVFSESINLFFSNSNSINSIDINYHGCNNNACFFPGVTNLYIDKNVILNVVTNNNKLLVNNSNYFINKRSSRFMSPEELITFLGEDDETNIEISLLKSFVNNPVSFVNESGSILSVIFIIIGGLLLNLTPCVLPMIPVNIAIIGAGAYAGTKKYGFKIGSIYGSGIILAYGILGIVTVLTGSTFGELNSLPWFNLVIAFIFLILALVLFDFIKIDFSKLQNIQTGKNKGKYLTAFSMGSLSGLLAGACIAPVVIAVLILASETYKYNPLLALSLPFLLGFGMALPWPFIGAGILFIPKPGKWMIYIKYLFGIIILLFSVWYAGLFFKGISNETNENFISSAEELNIALAHAKNKDKKVLLDFWAYWCKSCKELDKSFEDQEVKKVLNNYIFIKFDASDLDKSEKVLEKYDVFGLPTLLILENKKN